MTIGTLLPFAMLFLVVGMVSAKDTKDTTGTKVAKDTKETRNEHAVRNATDKFVTLETDYGKMTLELFHDVAPAHTDSFLARSKDGFYKGTIFHRVINGFMIQGGDPTGTGGGTAGYTLKAEFSKLKHVEGTLSMARPGDINGASCQFFICLGPTPQLDGQYTIFGQLINGYKVLHKIGSAEVEVNKYGENSKPKVPVHIIKAYQSDAQGNPI